MVRNLQNSSSRILLGFVCTEFKEFPLVYHSRRAWCFCLVLQLEVFGLRDVTEECFVAGFLTEMGV